MILQYSHSVDVQYPEQTHLSSTHGVIYILGIGTDGNGVIDDQTGIGDLSGVEFGAKERFIPATEIGSGSIMFDFPDNCTKQTNTEFTDTMETTKIQAHLVKSLFVRKVVSSQKRSIIRIYKTDGTGAYTYSGAAQDEATTFSEVGSGSLFAIGGISETKTSAELVAGTSIFNGDGRCCLLCSDSRKYSNTYTIWRGICLRVYESTMDLELSHSATTSRLLLESELSLDGIWYSLWTWFCCRINSRTICCKSNSYRYHRCCRIQDTNSSIPRLHSIWYIHTIWRTYTSRYRLHTSIHWSWSCNYYLEQHYSKVCPEVASGTATLLWICNSQIYSRRSRRNSPLRYKRRLCTYQLSIKFTDTTETTKIQAHLVLQQYLVLVSYKRNIRYYGYYGDDKDPGTSGTFTFSNTPLVHPDVRYIPSIGIGVAVLYQTGGSATRILLPSPTTRLKEDSKDLQVLKNPSVEQLTLVLVRLNTFGIAQEEYAVFEEPRTYVVII